MTTHNTKNPCPSCYSEGIPILYMGLPMHLCLRCEYMIWGAWANLLEFLPFTGSVVIYPSGRYVIGLVYWLTDIDMYHYEADAVEWGVMLALWIVFMTLLTITIL